MEISHYRHPKLHSSHSVTEHCFPYVTNSCFESVKHENVFRALINALALSFIYSFIYLLIYLFIYLFIYLYLKLTMKKEILTTYCQKKL